MSNNDKTPNIERLLEVLNTFGSNPEKWPRIERAGLVKLLDQEREVNPTLCQEYEVARVLDQFLKIKPDELGTTLSDNITSVTEAILVQIKDDISRDQERENSNNSDSAISSVINLDHFKKLKAADAGDAREDNQPAVYRQSGTNWRAAALLAATFLFGIYVGTTMISEPAVEGVAALAGNNNSPSVEFTLFQNQPHELFGEDL